MESKPAKKNQKEEVKGAKEPLVIDGQTVPEEPEARAQWVEDQRSAYIAKMKEALNSGKGNMFELKTIK